MPNPFDTFVQTLADDGTTSVTHVAERLTARELDAWLARRLEEDAPDWVLTDLTDEITAGADQRAANDLAAKLLLSALANDRPAAAGLHLSSAFRRVVAKDALRKAASIQFVRDFAGPLRTALDSLAAIDADRRALAREHNGMVRL